MNPDDIEIIFEREPTSTFDADTDKGISVLRIEGGEELKKEILTNQEKAEKYDKVLKALEQSGDLAIQTIMNLENKE